MYVLTINDSSNIYFLILATNYLRYKVVKKKHIFNQINWFHLLENIKYRININQILKPIKY